MKMANKATNKLTVQDQEILERVKTAHGGLVMLPGDRKTFFAVKKLERLGFLDYSGREAGGILVSGNDETKIKKPFEEMVFKARETIGPPETVGETVRDVLSTSSGFAAKYAGSRDYKEIEKYLYAAAKWAYENEIVGRKIDVLNKYNEERIKDAGEEKKSEGMIYKKNVYSPGDRVITTDGPGVVFGREVLKDGSRTDRYVVTLDSATKKTISDTLLEYHKKYNGLYYGCEEMKMEDTVMAPKESMWGPVDVAEEIMEGVFSVSTARHGGIMIREDVAEKLLSKAARRRENIGPYNAKGGGYYQYEEDAGWTIPTNEIKEIFDYCKKLQPGYILEKAIRDNIEKYYPEYKAR